LGDGDREGGYFRGCIGQSELQQHRDLGGAVSRGLQGAGYEERNVRNIDLAGIVVPGEDLNRLGGAAVARGGADAGQAWTHCLGGRGFALRGRSISRDDVIGVAGDADGSGTERQIAEA